MTTATAVARFAFDEDTHIGTIDGIFAPSVTQVLVDNRLIDPSKYNEKARQRGKVVHAVLANIHHGYILDWTKLHVDLHGYVNSALGFHTENQTEIIDSESRLFNADYRVHGGRDLKLRFPGRKQPAICDYKTGEVEFWTRYQLAAYDYLDGGGNEKYGIKLYEDGRPGRLVPFNEPDHYHDGAAFLSFLSSTHRRIQHGIVSPTDFR